MWPLIGPKITKAAVIAGWRRAAITQSGGDRGLAKGVDHPKAVIAAWRRAAVKVMVFRYPKGAFPIRRMPRTAHRRSGVMLRLAVRHWARTGGAFNGSLSPIKTSFRMLTPPGCAFHERPTAFAHPHSDPAPRTDFAGWCIGLCTLQRRVGVHRAGACTLAGVLCRFGNKFWPRNLASTILSSERLDGH